jgi:methyl-accepting chemotaxis protein
MRSPSSTHRPGWFADQRLAVKFGLLVTVVVLALAGLLTGLLMSHASVSRAGERADAIGRAEALVLQLDTRAAEFEVDALRALASPDPAAEPAGPSDGGATAGGLLDELAAIPLSGDSATTVDALEESYGVYTAAITGIVGAAVADRATAATGYQSIQLANDVADSAVGAAEDALGAASAEADERVAAALHRADLTGIAAVAVGLLMIVGLCLLTQRSLARPLGRVEAALQAMAHGDLTVESGVVARDEVGRVAAALGAAQENLRNVVAWVAESAEAVAAASAELSASAVQITASAEETSAQSGVVSSAAAEVSRSVATLAAGAEEMIGAVREISRTADEAAWAAAQAVAEARVTTVSATAAATASQEMGAVVRAITSIAEQTNLLALNATIEAARATEDIARRVQATQGGTGGAVSAIGRISEIIGSIEIAPNGTGVPTAGSTTAQSLDRTRQAVDELARMAGDLRGSVAGFTY